MSFLGKSNHSGFSKKKNYFNLKKDTDLVVRILPPMGALATKGIYRTYYQIEYGHRNSDGRLKPFVSPRVENRQTKMVEVESISHVRRVKLEAAREAFKKDESKPNLLTIASILTEYYKVDKKLLTGKDTVLKLASDTSENFNLDKKHYFNAITPDGQIGLLKLGHKAWQAVKLEIDRLIKEEGVDPTDADTGRFFVLRKGGVGRDTTFSVRLYKEVKKTEHGRAEFDVTHVIENSLIDRLRNEAFELDNLYPKVSAEEEERIVNEGSLAVDEILGKFEANQAPKAAAKPLEEEYEDVPQDELVSTPIEDMEEFSLEDEPLVVAPPKAVKKPEVKKVAPKPAKEQDLVDLSDDDFMEALSSGKF